MATPVFIVCTTFDFLSIFSGAVTFTLSCIEPSFGQIRSYTS